MDILAVTANGRDELAGAGLSSFVGFFSRTYREHDYLVGRKKAREYLESKEVKKILGGIPPVGTAPVRPADFTKTPVPLWRALLAGGPELLWIVIWRIVHWWPTAIGTLVIIILIALALIKHFLR
jgi:hypothetical protein